MKGNHASRAVKDIRAQGERRDWWRLSHTTPQRSDGACLFQILFLVCFYLIETAKFVSVANEFPPWSRGSYQVMRESPFLPLPEGEVGPGHRDRQTGTLGLKSQASLARVSRGEPAFRVEETVTSGPSSLGS